jgi:hypothetical protein
MNALKRLKQSMNDLAKGPSLVVNIPQLPKATPLMQTFSLRAAKPTHADVAAARSRLGAVTTPERFLEGARPAGCHRRGGKWVKR